MKKNLLFILIAILFIACGKDNDDNNDYNGKVPNEVTYYVTSSPAEATEIMVTYMDSQGNTIAKTVDSGWRQDVKTHNNVAVIVATVTPKKEYLGIVDYNDCSCTVQILHKNKVLKEATGNVVNVNLY